MPDSGIAMLLTLIDRGFDPRAWHETNLRGSNWFRRLVGRSPNNRPWKRAVALLLDTHARLREAIAGLTRKDLERIPRGSRMSTPALIAEVAAHDVYRAGQIQLLKRLNHA
jgi:hypothetical protein